MKIKKVIIEKNGTCPFVSYNDTIGLLLERETEHDPDCSIRENGKCSRKNCP